MWRPKGAQWAELECWIGKWFITWEYVFILAVTWSSDDQVYNIYPSALPVVHSELIWRSAKTLVGNKQPLLLSPWPRIFFIDLSLHLQYCTAVFIHLSSWHYPFWTTLVAKIVSSTSYHELTPTAHLPPRTICLCQLVCTMMSKEETINKTKPTINGEEQKKNFRHIIIAPHSFHSHTTAQIHLHTDNMNSRYQPHTPYHQIYSNPQQWWWWWHKASKHHPRHITPIPQPAQQPTMYCSPMWAPYEGAVLTPRHTWACDEEKEQ